MSNTRVFSCIGDSTAIGIRAKDGVVLAVEKLVTSKLYEHGANKRIFNIDRHIGMCIAGLLADARAIVEIARDEAANYRNQYRSPVPLKVSLSVGKGIPSILSMGLASLSVMENSSVFNFDIMMTFRHSIHAVTMSRPALNQTVIASRLMWWKHSIMA